MRASNLFLHDHFGEVLQHAVRGDGTNAGHRLFMRPRRLQGQNLRIRNTFNAGVASVG